MPRACRRLLLGRHQRIIDALLEHIIVVATDGVVNAAIHCGRCRRSEDVPSSVHLLRSTTGVSRSTSDESASTSLGEFRPVTYVPVVLGRTRPFSNRKSEKYLPRVSGIDAIVRATVVPGI